MVPASIVVFLAEHRGAQAHTGLAASSDNRRSCYPVTTSPVNSLEVCGGPLRSARQALLRQLGGPHGGRHSRRFEQNLSRSYCCDHPRKRLQLRPSHLRNMALMSLREVYRVVVNILTSYNVMVILDNHVSKPQWCCSNDDGNGYWGDKYFDVETWMLGLTTVASMFSNNPFVVGMSLRNELRGPRQDPQQWRELMSQAAGAIHDVNPSVLILAGGLNYATDLSFLNNNRALDTSRFPRKIVYEFHWYRWFGLSTRGANFSNPNDTSACSTSQSNVHVDNGFILDEGAPLILSEFGINLASVDFTENRFLDCIIAYLGSMDLDWRELLHARRQGRF